MNKHLVSLTAAVAIVLSALLPLAAHAAVAAPANPATAQSEAAVTIVRPLAIANTQSLDFGFIAAGANAGSVKIATNGARSGSNVTLIALGSTPHQAQFQVTGEGAVSYSISLPKEITLGSAAGTLTVNDFVSDPSGTGTLKGDLGRDGEQTVNVGATLQVPANAYAGTYTGTFDVTVNYN
jgi:hypothetical protein